MSIVNFLGKQRTSNNKIKIQLKKDSNQLLSVSLDHNTKSASINFIYNTNHKLEKIIASNSEKYKSLIYSDIVLNFTEIITPLKT